ncbi:Superoxide dismutase [Cu-Zn], chloroplastic [Portunus trituberculatus]|uniref:Superoxide dismutase [Cu-Zn], chloroplastic n=1 Tax=Portunus trituberculatus TaxID=210409 RepID=A0A5B7K0L1_PORTR|nr:Superoxide dismutase [Cu-Zn], chloroplastic [Portunus trituberculatus]
MYTSTKMTLPDLTGPRKLYLAVMGALHPDHLWACTKLRPVLPKKARAVFDALGVTGKITLTQASLFAPTDVTLALEGLGGMAGGFHVHELPALPQRDPGVSHCSATKGHYNPYGVDVATSPEPGLGAHDQYELGDLSGKHGMLLGLEDAQATVTDHNLPLFGPRSVLGRGLVIHKAEGARWVCANLRPTTPQIRAAVTFRYPLVGEMIFEQEADDPHSDTSVLVTYLVYSDGSRNTTGDHRWHVHLHPPGRDFYNWTKRCVSAGPRYNPFKVR